MYLSLCAFADFSISILFVCLFFFFVFFFVCLFVCLFVCCCCCCFFWGGSNNFNHKWSVDRVIYLSFCRFICLFFLLFFSFFFFFFFWGGGGGEDITLTTNGQYGELCYVYLSFCRFEGGVGAITLTGF